MRIGGIIIIDPRIHCFSKKAIEYINMPQHDFESWVRYIPLAPTSLALDPLNIKESDLENVELFETDDYEIRLVHVKDTFSEKSKYMYKVVFKNEDQFDEPLQKLSAFFKTKRMKELAAENNLIIYQATGAQKMLHDFRNVLKQHHQLQQQLTDNDIDIDLDGSDNEANDKDKDEKDNNSDEDVDDETEDESGDSVGHTTDKSGESQDESAHPEEEQDDDNYDDDDEDDDEDDDLEQETKTTNERDSDESSDDNEHSHGSSDDETTDSSDGC